MEINTKFSAILVSVLVIGSLYLIGGVDAFNIDLDALDHDVVIGSIVNFVANIQVDEGEEVEIDYLVLDLDGPVSISCTFLPDGTKITSCNGINIEKISGDYGYGYGYGVSGTNLTYNITIESGQFPFGNYQSRLFILSSSEQFSTEGPEIIIRNQEANLERCSVRAEDGMGTVEGMNLSGKSKLNFNIPASEATSGQGSLTIQAGSKRFSYGFDILDVLSNSATNSTILVEGEYRLNRNTKVTEKATITIDKKNNKVSVVGKDFSFKNMDVSLIQGCR